VTRIAIIGGTGTALLVPSHAAELPGAATRWGEPSGALLTWREGEREIVYLPRHGTGGGIGPHRVNYRANIETLAARAPDFVIGVNTVGGITPAARTGRLAVPSQLIDYTWGRAHTFDDGSSGRTLHVEFEPPFDPGVRDMLIAAARAAGLDVMEEATYGVTQGPRLETAAEIDRLAADGCDIVGMTAMPEAALAREAGLRYAICAPIVNRAAGRLPPGSSIHAEMGRHLDGAMAHVRRVLAGLP
jgi:5'-methylthioinosine phosphorylase